jgi:hypothetical protein
MSEDETITDEDRTNEVGFFNTAETYWKSAQALYNAKVKATHPLSPVLFLYYHAIELYFKAFLRGHGFELSPKVGDGGNRKGGISWGCLTPPLLH